MGPEALADRIGKSPILGRELIRLHQETYSKFWRWSDAAVDHAILHGNIGTVFGWRLHTAPGANSRSLRNFPMQANGAEMLRLACCLGTERGIELCAPVHDAVLIAAPLYRLEEDVAAMQDAMREASSSCWEDSNSLAMRSWCAIPTAMPTHEARRCGAA